MADLCSQRPGDLLQNLVQTSVTEALTDLGHVKDTQDEPEEVDGEKITQAIANTVLGTGNPLAGQGAQYRKERKEEEKKSKDTSKAKRARARTGTSANERKPEEARQEEQNQGPVQGQGQKERNKPSEQTLNQEEREEVREDHKCSELTTRSTNLAKKRPVPPP